MRPRGDDIIILRVCLSFSPQQMQILNWTGNSSGSVTEILLQLKNGQKKGIGLKGTRITQSLLSYCGQFKYLIIIMTDYGTAQALIITIYDLSS